MQRDWRDDRIEELERLLAAALERIAELEALLRSNSSNSSRPPSSDVFGGIRRRGSGGKRGGRRGHKPHQRRLFPPEDVTRRRRIEARQCRRCGSRRVALGNAVRRHQVAELPKLKPVVTEYEMVDGCCRDCGKDVWASLPLDVTRSSFGPKLLSTIAVLTGRFRLSRRMTQELLNDVFDLQMSLGAIADAERRISSSLEAPVREARQFVRNAPIVQPDETGWRQGKRRAWLWVARAKLVTIFRIARSRGSGIARLLLGRRFAGHIVSDRWCAYNWIDPRKRQVCWAHLKREFEGMADRAGPTGRFGRGLRRETTEMFEHWGAFRAGEITRRQLRRRLKPVQRRVRRRLHGLSRHGDSKARATARDLLRLERALWTFVEVDGLEPTNNAAEQAIRPAVMWRKTSFGTDSAEGSRFVERMLTVTATLRQQGRNVLSYIEAVYRQAILRKPVPSLLPSALAEG